MYILHEIPHSIFHTDKGILYTVGELIKRPAAAIQEYIEGKRVRHFRPLAYVVILSALSSFTGYLVSMTFDGTDAIAAEGILPKSAAFFSRHPSIFYFLMIPLISLCTFGFFRNQYNYWENVVLNTYLTAQFNFLLILSYILILVLQQGFTFIPILIVYFTYLSYVYSRFFIRDYKGKKYVLRIAFLTLLVVLVYITGLSFAGMMTPWW